MANLMRRQYTLVFYGTSRREIRMAINANWTMIYLRREIKKNPAPVPMNLMCYQHKFWPSMSARSMSSPLSRPSGQKTVDSVIFHSMSVDLKISGFLLLKNSDVIDSRWPSSSVQIGCVVRDDEMDERQDGSCPTIASLSISISIFRPLDTQKKHAIHREKK